MKASKEFAKSVGVSGVAKTKAKGMMRDKLVSGVAKSAKRSAKTKK